MDSSLRDQGGIKFKRSRCNQVKEIKLESSFKDQGGIKFKRSSWNQVLEIKLESSLRDQIRTMYI